MENTNNDDAKKILQMWDMAYRASDYVAREKAMYEAHKLTGVFLTLGKLPEAVEVYQVSKLTDKRALMLDAAYFEGWIKQLDAMFPDTDEGNPFSTMEAYDAYCRTIVARNSLSYVLHREMRKLRRKAQNGN